MTDDDVCLGICYSDNQLFYSVNSPGILTEVQHIGAFDFNFNVQAAIVNGEGESFSGIKNSVRDTKERFNCTSVRILSPATEECITILPRSVYEDTNERESHIRTLMPGIDRSKIEVTWYPLSNVDQRLLLIRNSDSMKGFRKLLGDLHHAEYVADFELGSEWQTHTRISGSFLTIHCGRYSISISSFLLGKLRGCTHIQFDHKDDLPYFWNLYGSRQNWMSGIHEQIYFFGYETRQIMDTLTPFWDDSGGEYMTMNTLDKMNISASEETYGFPLERAFPAILLCLNHENQLSTHDYEDHNRNS